MHSPPSSHGYGIMKAAASASTAALLTSSAGIIPSRPISQRTAGFISLPPASRMRRVVQTSASCNAASRAMSVMLTCGRFNLRLLNPRQQRGQINVKFAVAKQFKFHGRAVYLDFLRHQRFEISEEGDVGRIHDGRLHAVLFDWQC